MLPGWGFWATVNGFQTPTPLLAGLSFLVSACSFTVRASGLSKQLMAEDAASLVNQKLLMMIANNALEVGMGDRDHQSGYLISGAPCFHPQCESPASPIEAPPGGRCVPAQPQNPSLFSPFADDSAVNRAESP
ncbi:exported hypothetical protein [Verrucomicrobia bacterium]|nr:exported hypothetical protein [Verrucomicrobiota bacterium]